MTQPSPELAARMAASKSTPSDRLSSLREKCRRARDLRSEIDDLDSRLEDRRSELHRLTTQELVDDMVEAGVPSLTLEAEGNQPAFRLNLQPYYSANISAKWDPERRAEAFRYLEETGNGDLIKTEIVLLFKREERSKALDLLRFLREKCSDVEVNETVHSGTLTSWLRESIEEGSKVDLEKIGGHVGRVVKIGPVKKEK